ncbi:hypothetical protein MYP_1728 [Sporocytophaga myxococcoides]|uniref:Secretion system C-terminal sorting domain-containing protein n=1 Tax=Sporocytophaga myxococcoides TaxID=153721 RepID=A0A098LC20_9BACT|nr:T9SS type A sorting domain-containing protein [Sporocytophaga myxococcoides]GAL84500.1 hypothetical protein MYP_1728 [Sporocytophaga myxococcoides]
MKKIVIKFLLLFAVVPSFAQIENSGFENWEINSNGVELPSGWSSEFTPVSTSDLPVKKDQSSYSGSYAVTLKNILEERQSGGVVTTYANVGTLFLGSFDRNDYKLPGQSINEIPAAITGYYKFSQGATQDSDNYDTATVEVVLAKWNPSAEVFDILVRRTLKIYETKIEYTKFTINLDYEGNIIPDKLSIIFSTAQAGQISDGTSLTIDDLSYSTVTSVSTPISSLFTGKAYPNPATDEVKFIDLPEESSSIMVKDISGRVVKKLSLTSDNIDLDTTDLNSGMYLYTVLGRGENVLYTGKFAIKK